jgi:hypothetical protein
MIAKIYKAVMILVICLSSVQIWTNFETYIAYDNLLANPTSNSGLEIMMKNSTRLDDVISYRFFALLASIILTIFSTNVLYNKARAKINQFDLAKKYSKKRIIGSFFIPFYNLVMPRLCINELEHILRPDNINLHNSNSFKKRNRAGDIWWVLLLGSSFLHRILGSYVDSTIESAEDLNAIVSIMNKYLIGETVVSILLLASMLSGIKYFDYLFQLGENPGERSGT